MKIFIKYPNFSVVIASIFWGSYWIPLRFINKTGNESVWPIIVSFFILSIFLIKPLINSLKYLYIDENKYFFIGSFYYL